MRIVFIGAVEFSRRALECLLTMNAEVVGVCTKRESKFNADHVDCSAFSETHGIPSFYADDINSEEALKWVGNKRPDIILCFGWSGLLKQDMLSCAPLGAVGFHPAALPANRGRHPIIWALVLGLKETASTFFFMDAGADSGDILSQRKIFIDDDDDARSLYNKVIDSGLGQIEEFVPQLAAGTYQRRKQESQLANSWRKRGIADGRIDWRMSARSIHNLVRGLSKPYFGADLIVGGREFKVWKTVVVLDAPKNIEPGKVFMSKDFKHVVKCGEDAICLLTIEPPIELTLGGYL